LDSAAGFESAGFESTGLASAALASAGFTSVGLASAAFAGAAALAGASLAFTLPKAVANKSAVSKLVAFIVMTFLSGLTKNSHSMRLVA
jgi:hypothetical protein